MELFHVFSSLCGHQRPAFRSPSCLVAVADDVLGDVFPGQHAAVGEPDQGKGAALFIDDLILGDNPKRWGFQHRLHGGEAGYLGCRLIGVDDLAAAVIDDDAISNTLQNDVQLITRLPHGPIEPGIIQGESGATPNFLRQGEIALIVAPARF